MRMRMGIVVLAIMALLVAGALGCAEEEKEEVTAGFTASPTSGIVPLEVQFTDQSTGEITGWEWDFNNDGTVDSTAQNPSHTYDAAGTYTVSLEVTGPDGSDTETKVGYITVAEVGEVIAEFTASPTSGIVPLEVQFTDQSTGEITGWDWDFDNDGTVDSTEQNPSHTYATVGTYTVSLTVTGPDDSDTEAKTNYIEVEEKVTIVVGYITDLSGPASAAFKWVTRGLEDWVRYINEEDPIPGATLVIETYDCQYNPAEDVPGYEWVKEKGAQVVIAPITGTAETLKIFAEEDNIPIMCLSPSLALLTDPPGWVFAPNPPTGFNVKTLLEWVGTQAPYDTGTVKVATVGQNIPAHLERVRGATEYCADNPRFEHIEVLAAYGTEDWTGEILTIEDFDPDLIHVASIGGAAATFIEQFRARGNDQKIISTYEMWAFQASLVGAVGAEDLDGSWMFNPLGFWGEPSPIWQQAESLLNQYNTPEEVYEAIQYFGTSYINAWGQLVFFDILREAVEQVGAQNFDGQAFFDAMTQYSRNYEGFEEWTYTDGKRYAMRHGKMYVYDADLGNVIQITGELLPLIED